jgi:hypothetical protein
MSSRIEEECNFFLTRKQRGSREEEEEEKKKTSWRVSSFLSFVNVYCKSVHYIILTPLFGPFRINNQVPAKMLVYLVLFE